MGQAHDVAVICQQLNDHVDEFFGEDNPGIHFDFRGTADSDGQRAAILLSRLCVFCPCNDCVSAGVELTFDECRDTVIVFAKTLLAAFGEDDAEEPAEDWTPEEDDDLDELDDDEEDDNDNDHGFLGDIFKPI